MEKVDTKRIIGLLIWVGIKVLIFLLLASLTK